MNRNKKVAKELIKLAKSLISVKLPSEEKSGKPEHDDDFKAGFETAKKVLKQKVKDPKNAQQIYDANTFQNRYYGKVKGKHGIEWSKGWDGAFAMIQGLNNYNSYQVAKKMGLKIASGSFIASDPIRFEYFIVKPDKISVSSSSTNFANHERQKFSDDKISDAIDKLKKIQVLAKKKGVRLKNVQKRASELKKLESDYKSKSRDYNKMFDELYKTWKKIEKKKDLFYPPLVDLEKRLPEYKKALSIGNKINTMFYGGEVLSKVGQIDFDLTRVLSELSRSSNDYSMLSV